MANCRKCSRPIHPFSRYAAIGIGPECLRKENDKNIKKFMDEMNLSIDDKDLEYTRDLIAANDVEVEDKKTMMRLVNKNSDIKEMLKKVAGKSFYIPEMTRINQFDEMFVMDLSFKKVADITINIADSDGDEVALEMSRRRNGRSNEEIRKMGIKKFIEKEGY